jgi:Cu/Ag efflux protein CusF
MAEQNKESGTAPILDMTEPQLANMYVVKFFDAEAQELSLHHESVSKIIYRFTKNRTTLEFTIRPKGHLLNAGDFAMMKFVKVFYLDRKGEVATTYAFEIKDFDASAESSYETNALLEYKLKIKA